MTADELPEFSRTSRLGSKGVRLVHSVVEDALGWVFREQTAHDLGIDAHIEVVNDQGRATGKVIAAQIKCGASFFRETVNDGHIFRPARKHVNYWTGHSLPVVVIICHPELEECLWIEASSETISTAKNGWKILIPFGQKFDVTYKHALKQIAGRTLAERVRQRYRRRLATAPVISDKEFVEIIHRGGILMGFNYVSRSDYRALAFSEAYVLYQSDSFYSLEKWKEIFELSGVENWEIDEAIEKIVEQ